MIAAPNDRAAGRSYAQLLLLASGLLLGLRLLSLPLYPLFDRTESRYGEIARTMIERSDYLMPHIGADPFFGKPPLSTWCQAGSVKLFGLSEFSLRLPGWIAVALCVWLVVRAARCLAGRAAGSRAGLVFLTFPLTVAMAGAVMTDPYLGLGVALSLLGVIQWMAAPPDSRRARTGALLLVPVGLTIGFLSKGPVALLPLACAALALLGSAEGRTVLRRFPFGHVLGLTLLMSAPWFVLAEWQYPGYARYFFLGEHFERFLNARWTGDRYGGTHPRPLGTIWLLLFVGALPWVRQIWRLVGRGSRERRAATGLPRPVLHALLGAAFGPLVIFTFAGSVLPTYPFPALIGLAILLGVGAADASGTRSRRPRPAERRLVYVATACVAAVVLVVSLLPPAVLVQGTQRDVVRDTQDKHLLYARDTRFLYSASFYSGGRASGVKSPEHKIWRRVRAAPHRWLVVVRDEDYEPIPLDLRSRLLFERRVGPAYCVFSVTPARGSS